MEKIQIGEIVNTFGIRGEVKVKSFSDFNEVRFAPDNELLLEKDGQSFTVVIQQYKEHKGMVLLQFQGMEDINLVEKWKGALLYTDKEELHELEDGEYYVFQLRDLTVLDEAGNVLGKVLRVEPTGAQNNLRIKLTEGKEVLIPYVDAFVKEVDLEKETVTVHIIEGLL